MPTFGFKLLEIQVFRGRGRTAFDFGDTDRVHYLDRIMEDFGAASPVHENRGEGEGAAPLVVGSDDVVALDEPEVGTRSADRALAVVRIESARRYRSAVLLDTVYGLVGDHSLGIDPSGVAADTDLTALATTRHYRAAVVAPDSGKTGYLAVEVISGSHAGGRLTSRLHQGAKDHNFKLRTFGSVADEASVRDLEGATRISEVRLFKTLIDEDSASPRTVAATITIPIGKESSREARLRSDFVPRWLPTRANKNRADSLSAAEEANSLAQYLWPALGDDEQFDNAEMLIHGRHRPKRLKPLDMKEGFTYDLGDVRPEDDDFLKQVADVIDGMSAAGSVNLEPDWHLPVAPER